MYHMLIQSSTQKKNALNNISPIPHGEKENEWRVNKKTKAPALFTISLFS